MKKMNLYFALLLGAMISFTACSKDDELTAEELEAKQTKELLETITANFDAITAKKWTLKEFQPSAEMEAVKSTNDMALTRIKDGEYAKNFNMFLSFVAEGDLFKANVAMNVPEAELETKVLTYLSELYGFPMTELWGSLESYLAQFRRVAAAPFAADNLTTDDITSEETGLCIFSIGMNDFSKLSYEDLVLAQKKLIKGNDDKIYLNEDGTLTVEATTKEFGVSKYIYTEVTE